VLRSLAKRRFFKFLEKALDHDSGRASLSKSMGGMPVRTASFPPFAQVLPYSDIGRVDSERVVRDDAVFVTGRFRSGSTLLWNVFRQCADLTSYYEPFNERRWFRADCRGERIDTTHLGVEDELLESPDHRALAADWPMCGS